MVRLTSKKSILLLFLIYIFNINLKPNFVEVKGKSKRIHSGYYNGIKFIILKYNYIKKQFSYLNKR